MSTKQSPPLFEILGRQRAGAQTESSEPQRAPEPAPPSQPPPPPEPEPTPDHRAATRFGSATVANGTLAMPLTYAYLALAIIIGLSFGAHAIGYWRGEQHAKSELARTEVTSPVVVPSDPLAQQPTGNQPSTPPQASDQPQTPRAAPSVLTARGTGVDPRRAEMNYLVIADLLKREDAEAALAFLAANGVDAVGVMRVDRRGRPDNNPPRFKLYATLGLSSGEYSTNPARQRLEQEIAGLGRRFSEQGGQTSFRGAFWEKYRP